MDATPPVGGDGSAPTAGDKRPRSPGSDPPERQRQWSSPAGGGDAAVASAAPAPPLARPALLAVARAAVPSKPALPEVNVGELFVFQDINFKRKSDTEITCEWDGCGHTFGKHACGAQQLAAHAKTHAKSVADTAEVAAAKAAAARQAALQAASARAEAAAAEWLAQPPTAEVVNFGGGQQVTMEFKNVIINSQPSAAARARDTHPSQHEVQPRALRRSGELKGNTTGYGGGAPRSPRALLRAVRFLKIAVVGEMWVMIFAALRRTMCGVSQ